MLPIVIIKAGETTPELIAQHGDFEDWVIKFAGLAPEQVLVVDVREDTSLPDFGTFSGAIMTGSHDMITETQPWITKTLDWIREMIRRKIPLLGICFGHQALGLAAGGMVDYHPDGKEVGTKNIQVTPQAMEDPLFRGMPQVFPAHVTHTQAVLEPPKEAVLLAYTDHEPHHAMRIGPCAWGVQFHPEFWEESMDAYIDLQAQALEAQGEDISTLHAQTCKTEASHTLLKRFVKIALEAEKDMA